MPAPVGPVAHKWSDADRERQRILDLIEGERVPERGPFTKHQNYAIDHILEVIEESDKQW
jgi:hypothetical protein